MARTRTHHRPRSNPHGILSVAADGFGFVQTAEGSFFIPASKLGGGFDGDEVEIAPVHVNYDARQEGKKHNRPGDQPTARVVSVLSRAHETVVGRYEVADPFGVVVPSDSRIPYDIFTMRADHPEIPDGSIVRVRMVAYPTRKSAATGEVVDVLGRSEDPATDVEAVIVRQGLPTEFPPSAVDAAEACRVDAPGALRAGYRDLTHRFTMTIDPVDARDFDDALSVEELEGGFVRLGVHIADVACYVPWEGPIDICARERATSVYLSDRVIPMLPEALSNDVCSLVPGHARRTLTVDMVLNGASRVTSVDIYESVISSQARLSYDQAQCYIDAFHRGIIWEEAAALAREEDVPDSALPLDAAAERRVFEALAVLDRIASDRRRMRDEAGGMDFSSTEAKVVLDEAGEPVDVRLRTRTAATGCVEEAMILANECVARHLLDTRTPALFRVHEVPARDALSGLVPVLREFPSLGGLDMAAVVEGDPFALQEALGRVRGKPEEELVSSLILRSMQRAVYKDRCAPHFGLASPAYCHFTSPIRRYPDLVVHRSLKALLHGGPPPADQTAALPLIAEHASKMERIADAAARETQEIALVRYMARFVGQRFEGVVSGIAQAGVFVRLPNTVEGVVPMRHLGAEYFSLDPERRMLVGEDTGRTLRLGQRVDVRIAAAPDHARKLDLRLA
ncbi:ribonuclease R family protein [Curtanaerobium respiraculi]|uniref:ribonuclease R family protein n=1 Tax=Curtanaerobium respiraculi TaxID=2949669 RepID=UPI0024B37840|nr:RNB domain-containing ribonuclease [Curtanaerobium respiraculi]